MSSSPRVRAASMTGIAVLSLITKAATYNLVIKSINSKGLDLKIALGESLSLLEADLRTLIAKHVGRGRVELTINVEQRSGAKARETVDCFKENLKIFVRSGISKEQATLLAALKATYPHHTSGSKTFVLPVGDKMLLERRLVELLRFFVRSRQNEGRLIVGAINESLSTISDAYRAISIMERKRKPKTSLEQQIKSDVSEELQRISGHLQAIKATLNKPLAGRKVDFLAQELLREVSTLAAKTAHFKVQAEVIECKLALERIREQAQNLE